MPWMKLKENGSRNVPLRLGTPAADSPRTMEALTVVKPPPWGPNAMPNWLKPLQLVLKPEPAYMVVLMSASGQLGLVVVFTSRTVQLRDCAALLGLVHTMPIRHVPFG